MSKFIFIFLYSSLALISAPKDTTYFFPYLRLGISAAPQINMIGLGYQNLSPRGADFTSFELFEAKSLRFNLGANAEIISGWNSFGVEFNYDRRGGIAFDPSYSPQSKFNIRNDYLSSTLYFKLHPEIFNRIYIRGGVVAAFNINSNFDFTADESTDWTERNLNISDMNSPVYGLRAGLGYNLYFDNNLYTRYYISPFVEADFLMRQRKTTFQSIEQNNFNGVWSTLSLRAGINVGLEFFDIEEEILIDQDKLFVLIPPVNNIIRERKVREYFTVLNVLFINAQDSEIPNRYITLTKPEAKKLLDTDIVSFVKEKYKPKDERELKRLLYYNLMNIYGMRMKEDTTVVLKLVGYGKNELSSKNYCAHIVDYMSKTFTLPYSRFVIEGQIDKSNNSADDNTIAKQKHFSEEEKYRVEFIFENEKMYSPIVLDYIANDLNDNDFFIKIINIPELKNWQINLGSKVVSKSIGPFYGDVARVNASEFLKSANSADFRANVIFFLNNGKNINDTEKFSLKKRIDTADNQRSYQFTIPLRFALWNDESSAGQYWYESFGYNFDQNYRIQVSSFGDGFYEEKKSIKKSEITAREIKRRIQNEYSNLRVKLTGESIGFGNNTMRSAFDYKTPEGRWYNRGGIIEMIPLDRVDTK